MRVHTADKNRRKGKANQETISPKCNKRFMTKEEVEYQLKREQLAKRNAEKKSSLLGEKFENGSRWLKGLLVLDDHNRVIQKST